MNTRLSRGLFAGLLLGLAACAPAADDGSTDTAVIKDGPGDPSKAPPSVPGGSNPGTPNGNANVDPNVDGTPGSKPSTGEQPAATQPDPTRSPPAEPAIPAPTALALLAAATDCSDLLTRIQNDAIAKLMMQIEVAKKGPPSKGDVIGIGPMAGAGGLDFGPTTPPPQASPEGGSGGAPGPARDSATSGANGASGPVAASSTNKQVADVDEADFVKVVENGKGVFLLHGNTLQKLKSWPPNETARVGKPLSIEGTPSEMFVSEDGRAVVFSTVWGYSTGTPSSNIGGAPVRGDAALPCGPDYCGRGGNMLKITLADVTADPKVLRELYYEGSYLSSRRYDLGANEVVRAVVQASSKFNGLFYPQVQYYDSWGRMYDAANIASQLAEWEARTVASIRNTKLTDWLPVAKEAKGGKLVELETDCDSYFVPMPGLASYGLTHVLSLDISDATKPVGGVTIVGGASTVYSNAKHMVLAQPDYRTFGVDFGMTSEQQTALHEFELSGADTKYLASGWVPGQLPLHNPQFGVDVTPENVIRVATTGWVRKAPSAKPGEPNFGVTETVNYVSTHKIIEGGDRISQIARSVKLGKEGERVQSARFIGSRAYVVTFRQIDPLIIVDVANPAALPVLGEIEIPGFGQYIHPLDQNHIITFGQGANRNVQLQLFDVTDPKKIAVKSTLAFGPNSYSEASHNHKAFTFFEGVLAVPVSNVGFGTRNQFLSGLELVRADPSAMLPLQHLGFIDHGRLYASNGAGVSCGMCDAVGCFEYKCSYQPEVRRGHFVRGGTGTYVYSFSHAGVQVHDLAAPTRPLASVGLPAPVFQGMGPWYATPSTFGMTPTTGSGTSTATPPPVSNPPPTMR